MTNKSTYETEYCGKKVRIRANWAEASSVIELDTGEGWNPTRYLVADCSHRPRWMMKSILVEISDRSGGLKDEDFPVIHEAVENMKYLDDTGMDFGELERKWM